MDVNLEIKLQVVFGCTSKLVRRKALIEDLVLNKLVKFARTIETCTNQTEILEDQKSGETVNKENISNYTKSRVRQ